MKILLTSAGLETEAIKNEFLKLLPKSPQEIKALFIPTAAINADSICMLPKCINDLLKCNITKENIKVYDLHQPLSSEDIQCFDVVYICGGDKNYLLKRINEQGFNKVLVDFVEGNGIYVGVSAGSIIAAQNLRNNLGLINCYLSVHCDRGHTAGVLNASDCPQVNLTDSQAILITDIGHASIFE